MVWRKTGPSTRATQRQPRYRVVSQGVGDRRPGARWTNAIEIQGQSPGKDIRSSAPLGSPLPRLPLGSDARNRLSSELHKGYTEVQKADLFLKAPILPLTHWGTFHRMRGEDTSVGGCALSRLNRAQSIVGCRSIWCRSVSLRSNDLSPNSSRRARCSNNRRTFLSLSQAASPRPDASGPQPAPHKVALYAIRGGSDALCRNSRCGAIEAETHAARHVAYALAATHRGAISTGRANTAPWPARSDQIHHVRDAFRIDPAAASLTPGL